ncbi:MAG: 50S ribosomal protein L22 [Oscillospiraceae bacterium]|nr:50S ribosomal protein L22 [Oscillospiraceae bacterium]
MERKVMSKDELNERRDSILELYAAKHAKSKKPVILTKKERKALGIGKDEGRASIRNVRISSGKVRLLLNQIKGKRIHEAFAIIRNTPKAASAPVFRLLKSAEANAVNNNGLDSDALFVAEATATQGTTMKRIMPQARGSADRIRKRTSHITVVVKELPELDF